MILRDYQKNGVDNIRADFISGKRSVLYCLPTGAGKTATFTHIAANASQKKARVFILVHRKELLVQASLSLASYGVNHGIIAPPEKIRTALNRHIEKIGQSFIDQNALVQVASVQTLARRLHLVASANLVIVDEAHHGTAGSWRTIINAAPKARILGVTATPCRTDGQGLGSEYGGLFDSLIVGTDIAELTERGYLVPAEVYAPSPMLDLHGIRKTAGGDYNSKQLSEAIKGSCIVGDAVKSYSKICPGVPAVAFCPSVESAQDTAEQFRAAGYRFAAVHGSMSDDERDRLIDGLGSGLYQGLTSCDIISEGTDIPAITAAILLRPTASEGLYLQQVGRALRPLPGKDHAIILDHVGNSLVHGMPEEQRDWSLSGSKRSQRRDSSERIPNPVQCPKCKRVHMPSNTCPHCGHEYQIQSREIQQIDGELERVEAQQRDMLAKQRKREVSDAKTREELEKVAAQRGYKAGWVDHMLRLRQQYRRGGRNAA